MRAEADVHWWQFVAPEDRSYEVVLSDLPRNYGLLVRQPSGSSSTTNSGTTDRVRTVTLRPGQRMTIAVSVGTGGYSPDQPYRLTVR
jgi:hypothetical protein